MKLINKDALVAEIYKLKKSHDNWSCMGKCFHKEYESLLSFIDTLEVKEMDLEKAIKDYMAIHRLHIKDGGRIVFENNDSPNFMCDFRDVAKHFFELGMQVNNKAQKGE